MSSARGSGRSAAGSAADAALAYSPSAGQAALGLGRRQVILAWAGSRLLVFCCAALVQLTGLTRASWHPGFARHPFALLTIWDGRWYRLIAAHGYLLVPRRQSDPAFFPLLPVLLHGLHAIGLPYSAAGIALANGSFLIGLLALYELGREWLPEADARRGAVYAAISPLSFVFSMVYPEGLALAAIALAGLFAMHNRWLAAATSAALAGFARPEGTLIALPLAALAVQRWPGFSPTVRSRAFAAVLAAPATVAAVSCYFWSLLGNPLAWSDAQRAWGRSFALTGPYHALAELATSPSHHKAWLFKDATLCLVYLVGLLLATRGRLPVGWTAAGLAIVLLPLASGSFTSDARFGLLALPVYWGLSLAGRRPALNRVILAGSPLLLAASVLTLQLRFP